MIDIVIKIITIVSASVISLYLYTLNKRQVLVAEKHERDDWLRTYNELHFTFWNNNEYAKVRQWLACDNSYKDIEDLIKRRVKSRALIQSEEYAVLELIDRFYGYLIRVKIINPEFRTIEIWDKLYFQYWFDEVINADRYYLWVYLETCYDKIETVIGFSRKINLDRLNSYRKRLDEDKMKGEVNIT